MKKTIYLLNIDNYAPELTALTLPFIKKWAEKIGAEIFEITERKYPEFDIMYEKLQIKDIAKERGDDWVIYIDSDALVHPDLFDITELIPADTVLQHGKDFANNRWVYDNYFRRDGRNIGTCGWFTIANKMCLDVYDRPTDVTNEDILKNVYPIQIESNFGMTARHLTDDYIVSRNVAKYGLKYMTFEDLLVKLNLQGQQYFFHQHLFTLNEKTKLIKDKIEAWGLNKSKN
jgi:uncharacterized phage-associated protein